MSTSSNVSFKDSQCAVLNTLILLINHNVKYKNVLREAGLVDVMIVALKRYSTTLKGSCEGKRHYHLLYVNFMLNFISFTYLCMPSFNFFLLLHILGDKFCGDLVLTKSTICIIYNLIGNLHFIYKIYLDEILKLF